MAGFSTQTNEHLIRSNLWSREIKDILEDELIGTRYVKMITDFPDGDTLNIPSIGQAVVNDYVEGNPIQYTSMDTGNFTFSINKYKSSGTWITDKMKQDTFYMNELVSRFVPSQARAIAKHMEVDILATIPDGQTASNANAINGASHRWIGSGTNETIDLEDFAKARYALSQANVPLVNLVAIVDPSVEYKLSTQTNVMNLMTPAPQWQRIVNEGGLTGMSFKYNLYGFDIYVSQNLKSSLNETIGTKTTTSGVGNLFFSASADVMPVIGLIRQAPRVESKRNIDYQRDEYVTTCRYGFKTYRPENAITVITDTDQISF